VKNRLKVGSPGVQPALAGFHEYQASNSFDASSAVRVLKRPVTVLIF
jgi:hypothetical protein